MTTHSSATAREEAPYANETSYSNRTTGTATIMGALKRRAESVLNDTSIDPQSRAVIRYALETNDPWLAKLVRRADAGETNIEAIDFSQSPGTYADQNEDKIEALAEMICRAGDEPGTKSAALLVLMATFENASHAKVLANVAKHVAFTRCGALNLHGMVDKHIPMLEEELFLPETLDD